MTPDEAGRAGQLLRALTDGHRDRVAAAAESARAALERADRLGARPTRPALSDEEDDEEDYSTRTWLR